MIHSLLRPKTCNVQLPIHVTFLTSFSKLDHKDLRTQKQREGSLCGHMCVDITRVDAFVIGGSRLLEGTR